MSASGVDKSALHEIGRDILLVTGYDDGARRRCSCACPHGVEPRRVSVDAIEHWMIYREHPEVDAILHVHAWIEGTVATEINYPCGTVELAESVAELVRQAPDPQPRRRRPTQPRPHHHRPQPRRDLRPHRRPHRPQSPHGLTHCRGWTRTSVVNAAQ